MPRVLGALCQELTDYRNIKYIFLTINHIITGAIKVMMHFDTVCDFSTKTHFSDLSIETSNIKKVEDNETNIYLTHCSLRALRINVSFCFIKTYQEEFDQ